MLTRTTWQLFVPLVLMLTAAGLHWYGLIAVIAWTGIGYFAMLFSGQRKVNSFQWGAEWKSGWRKLVVVSYNLFWWPCVIKK